MNVKLKAIFVTSFALLISVVLGYSSMKTRGHESVVFPFLKTLFLLLHGIAFVGMPLIEKQKDKKTSTTLILAALAGILSGITIFLLVNSLSLPELFDQLHIPLP